MDEFGEISISVVVFSFSFLLFCVDNVKNMSYIKKCEGLTLAQWQD
jgi:hypothetical protein